MIPYGKQLISPRDIKAVAAVLESPLLTVGLEVEKFEASLQQVTGAKFVAACNNGTTALHLAVRALDLPKGSLGITSPITFLASANALEYEGLQTDFCDINPETLCLSVEALEKKCRAGNIPAVVVTVDLAGIPAELPKLFALKEKYNFYIIEDAAHSLGSTYHDAGKEYRCGDGIHADIITFSFHPVKTITTGEGGAVLTNNPIFAERIKRFRTHGMERNPTKMNRCDGPWYYEMKELGYNYRITDFQCALGTSQLEQLSEFKKRRTEIVTRYNAAFADDARFITPPMPKNTAPCYHLYPLQLTAGKEARLSLYTKLKAREIITQVHYIPVYWQPYYQEKYGFSEGYCPESDRYYYRTLSLPLYAALTDAEQSTVIDAIKELAY